VLYERYYKLIDDIELKCAKEIFPKITERKKWDSINKDLANKIIKIAENYTNYNWPSLTAYNYMEFTLNGNRINYEQIYFEKRNALMYLVLGECIENKGRFMVDIINGIWSICEESTWVLPAHNNMYSNYKGHLPLPDIEEQIIDLFAGETSTLLIITLMLIEERLGIIKDIISKRIHYEVRRRIINPYLNREDFGWMALNNGKEIHINNWNTWCNMNSLFAILFIEKDLQRKKEGIKKVIKSIDRFIESYASDGGCDEGASYFSKAAGSLFETLELLFWVSKGDINIYYEPKIGEMARFIYYMYIGEKYFVNFSDCSAIVNTPIDLIYRFGIRICDEKLISFAKILFKIYKDKILEGLPDSSIMRVLYTIFDYNLLESDEDFDYVEDIYIPSLELMIARSNDGFFVAAKGGHNNQSHNHNDVGNFIVYYKNKPILIDVGVETYNAKTFSNERYSIWTMQSSYHNLPEINGCMQQNGNRFRAQNVLYCKDEFKSKIYMDISQTYPKEAKVNIWQREIKLDKKLNVITIKEIYELNAYDEIKLNFICANNPMFQKENIIVGFVEDRKIIIEYEEEKLYHQIESIAIKDEKLLKVWGTMIYRIIFKPKSAAIKDSYTFLIKAI